MRQLLLAWFGAVVLLFVLLRGAIDMAASIDYAQETFPWLKRWAATKKWHRIVLLATCLFYGGTLYELLREPQPFVPSLPNPGSLPIATVTEEDKDLRAELSTFTQKEPDNSLRRRTIRIANDLFLFWSRRPVPPQPVANPNTDEDRKRNATFDAYWREANGIYESDYKDRVLGIVREYKNRGVPTGYLEQAAENHPFGASAFTMSGSPICWQDEVCLLRELAFHVDANDQMIGPNF